MRTRMLMPVLAAGALLLAGCGEEDGTTPGGQLSLSSDEQDEESAGSDGPGDPEDDGDPDTPRTPDGSGDPDPEAFNQRAEEITIAWPERLEPRQRKVDGGLWVVQGLAGTSPEDTTLVVAVGHGSCDYDWGSWVHETDELVIVGGWALTDPEVEACDDMMNVDDVEVALEAPLGDRMVLDASTAMDPRAEDFQDYS